MITRESSMLFYIIEREIQIALEYRLLLSGEFTKTTKQTIHLAVQKSRTHIAVVRVNNSSY